MEKIIDLHIHTNLSDGALSSKEIIDESSKIGLKTISITDHDTIEAYDKEIIEYARNKGINLIPGVEISTKINKCGIHVLGYNFDINNNELIEKLSLLRNARHDYLYNVSKKLNELGYDLNVQELDKIDAVTKAHISRDVVNNPKNKELLVKDFGYIPEMGEFIETIMNEGCKAYVKKQTISPKEAAKLIRNAGGKVVLAHPVAYQNEDNLTEENIKEIIKDMKADGIESYYIYTNRDNKKVNDIEKWNKIAEELNLITTIGSDFHKYDGVHVKLGFIEENININKEKIEEILEILNN